MSRRESIQKMRSLKYKALAEKKDIVNNKIVCNFDSVNGHVRYEDGMIVGPCLNRNICELNPVGSRFKDGLEAKRLDIKEKQASKSIPSIGELVCCDTSKCANHGMMELCHHGALHEWSESCTMTCNRYHDAYCKGG